MKPASPGVGSSGIPASWAATRDRPGIDLLPHLSDATADDVTGRVRAEKRPGDLAVVSIHSDRTGDGVGADQVRFAHRLIDGGPDLVHGHSAHHPRPIEVFRGKLVLYGYGDCINDYEGIRDHQEYRDDLRLLYFASVQPGTGELAALKIAAMQAATWPCTTRMSYPRWAASEASHNPAVSQLPWDQAWPSSSQTRTVPARSAPKMAASTKLPPRAA